MRYTPQIEQAIIQQIEREPEREVILPDWAYWKGVDTAWIYVDGMPTLLHRYLYELLIEPLPVDAGLTRKPGVHRRNVNPHLFTVVPTRASRGICSKGLHEYTEDDYIPGVGHRCQACRATKLLGIPSPADLNREKTHCPAGHPLKGKNLIRLKNGRRRCRICHAETQARYRARKRKTS